MSEPSDSYEDAVTRMAAKLGVDREQFARLVAETLAGSEDRLREPAVPDDIERLRKRCQPT